MDLEKQAKDVTALFERAGVRIYGKYRVFNGKGTIERQEGDAVPSVMRVEDESARAEIVPATDSNREQTDHASSFKASREGALPIARPFPEVFPDRISAAPALPPLDRLLVAAPASPSLAVTRRASRIALYSLAGGVGKTTLAMSIGRILSGRSRRMVILNRAGEFGFQHLLGPRAQKLGAFMFLHAPSAVSAFPLTLMESPDAGNNHEEAIELMRQGAEHADTLLLDMPSNRAADTRKVLTEADYFLVPLLPDVHSASSLQAVEQVLRDVAGSGAEVRYMLNRFDAHRDLHLEMYAKLKTMLGNRLLPFHVREEPLVQDAMRSGMTVVDYAPESGVVNDLHAVADWVEHLSGRLSVEGTSA